MGREYFMQRNLVRLGLVLGLFSLSACSGSDVVRAFGSQRVAPDEYTVTTRAPLAMPPSEKLALPGSDTHRPDQSARMQALETLDPDVALHSFHGDESQGQAELTGEADAMAKAPFNAELGDKNAGFVDQLMFWQGGKAGSVVDAEAENMRIERNSALGAKMNEGATPTTNAP